MEESDLDWDEAFAGLGEDWGVVETVLPEGWQEVAKWSLINITEV